MEQEGAESDFAEKWKLRTTVLVQNPEKMFKKYSDGKIEFISNNLFIQQANKSFMIMSRISLES